MTRKLTQTVQKGGCAAKVAATELRSILSKVKFPPSPPELAVGASGFDDAAIYKLNSVQTSQTPNLVQTLDFFTPIVDTPKWFGKIAAANSMSDVFAMGGTPITAMAILAFPLATMESEVVVEVLQGACEVLSQARTPLVGGHSIDDDTLKFGLSVTGLVNSKNIWSNDGAKPGDHLILTKALGTGTLSAGLKRQELSEEDMLEALGSMGQLNQVLPLMGNLSESVHAATDITGFGLAGHASHVALGSQVTLKIFTEKLPVFSLVRECLEKGFLTKAHRTNLEYIEKNSDFQVQDVITRKILVDPQTSGGLLLSVDPAQSKELVQSLKSEFPHTSVIGEVLPSQAHKLIWV